MTLINAYKEVSSWYFEMKINLLPSTEFVNHAAWFAILFKNVDFTLADAVKMQKKKT